MANRPIFRARFLLAALKYVPRPLAAHLMFLLRSNPSLTDRWGYHVRPIHYYEPLPDFARITPEQTRCRRESPAIHFNLPAQIALIRRLGPLYRAEIAEMAGRPEPDGFDFHNDYFSRFDAALYYAVLRDLKPSRVIEIGSGCSTRIADKALGRNRAEGRAAELICVEPYPQPRLTAARLEIELVQQPVESLDLAFFSRLQSGDVLFIDSSHAVKFGSDVCREFLDILPVLAPGVVVHVHDIFFPHNYPAEWLVEKRIAFSEQYLLEAFLAYNSAFEIMAANYWLNLDHSAVVSELWPGGAIAGHHGCASFWMRKVS
jgi:hypothetical protein